MATGSTSSWVPDGDFTGILRVDCRLSKVRDRRLLSFEPVAGSARRTVTQTFSPPLCLRSEFGDVTVCDHGMARSRFGTDSG